MLQQINVQLGMILIAMIGFAIFLYLAWYVYHTRIKGSDVSSLLILNPANGDFWSMGRVINVEKDVRLDFLRGDHHTWGFRIKGYHFEKILEHIIEEGEASLVNVGEDPKNEYGFIVLPSHGKYGDLVIEEGKLRVLKGDMIGVGKISGLEAAEEWVKYRFANTPKEKLPEIDPEKISDHFVFVRSISREETGREIYTIQTIPNKLFQVKKSSNPVLVKSNNSLVDDIIKRLRKSS